MTKKEQQSIAQEEMNRMIDDAINQYNEYISTTDDWQSVKQLRSCNAKVYTTKRYHVLMSYNTMVAMIDRRTDCLYDFLRLVYGFTSTSAQHISKFEKDYCKGKWNCAHRYTWRAC